MQTSTRIARHLSKELFRFVVAGSVDDGKSTLLGRLLFDAGALFNDQLADATVLGPDGVPHLDLSLVTDGLLAEREQAITIDVAYRYFATERRKFIVADTPGHLQYTRNMVTGASTADAALLLVDAAKGPTEQTRRHAFIAATLGIRNLIVCVNKMDLVGWERARFDAVAAQLGALLRETGFTHCHLVPVSATLGDNVVHRSANLPWAEATLLERLETLPETGAARDEPARLWVQLLLRSGDGVRRYAGQLATGRIGVGHRLRILPSNEEATISELYVAGERRERAKAGESVALRFDREVDCARGDLLASMDAPTQTSNRLDASLVWIGTQPLRPGARLLLRLGSRETAATVTSLLSRTDLDTLATAPCETLETNDLGSVRLALASSLPFEPFSQCRTTGAFVLIDPSDRATVGAGMVSAAAANLDAPVGRPTPDERTRRFGHAALLICLPTDTSAEARDRLERRLFDAGVATAQAATVAAAEALFAAGLVVITACEMPTTMATVSLDGIDEPAWWSRLQPLLAALRRS